MRLIVYRNANSRHLRYFICGRTDLRNGPAVVGSESIRADGPFVAIRFAEHALTNLDLMNRAMFVNGVERRDDESKLHGIMSVGYASMLSPGNAL